MRKLNAEELAIMEKKERRINKQFDVIGIEYRLAFPRTTLCLLRIEEIFDGDAYTDLIIGVAMRAKDEEDIPVIGEVIAFTRALNAL